MALQMNEAPNSCQDSEQRPNRETFTPLPDESSIGTDKKGGDSMQSSKGGRKICILTIDGGGMRGIIPARVLIYLEEALQKKSGDAEARIADYFDIVAGTSVGGLIATMLFARDDKASKTRPRPLFTSHEAWKLIAEKGKLIFKIPWQRRPLAKLRGILTPRYSTKNMESLLKGHLVDSHGRALTLKDTLKPVLIPCYDLRSAGVLLFSKADAMRSPSLDFNLWEVCRATAAVPAFFKPMQIVSMDGATSVTAIDGGLVMNNPTSAAVAHVLHNKAEFPEVNSTEDILVLSLGTGLFERSYKYETVRFWGAFQWAKPVVRIVLDGISDMVDHIMSIAFTDHRKNYLRIQVSGLPSRCLTEMDDPTSTNVKRLTKLAEDMFSQPCIEHIPLGGKQNMSTTNKEELDRFIECLMVEHQARATCASTNGILNPTSNMCNGID